MTMTYQHRPSEFAEEPLSTLDREPFPVAETTEMDLFLDDAVVLRDVHKSFLVDGQRHDALRGIDLRLKRGEIHGILGPSGAGKSTLLRCLLRLEQPNAGEILIDGRNWTKLSHKALRKERQRVGVVFQHLDLLTSRTVAANIALPLEIAGQPAEQRNQRVHELLSWFGITEKANEYPSRLSGGQRQRVALARALATSPSVLLADEPTSALDTENKLSVLNILRGIRDDFGVTVVLITHDLQAASALCDTLSLLENGQVIESGSTAEVANNPRTKAARRLFTSFQSPADIHPTHRRRTSFEDQGGL
jgi:D-methionine transport system ATP-binding protein